MSGSFNPVNLVSTVALAAVTGGGSLFAQLATQVFAQIGQQLIQQMGQQLGLPQSFINQVQDNFLGDVGKFQERAGFQDRGGSPSSNVEAFARESGASPAEIGESHRATSSFQQQIVRDMSESQDFREAKANRSGGRGGANTTNAPGWLMAMAEALGKKLDEMAADMETKAANISEKDPSSSAEFGVVSQQFSMLMNATNTAIKTIGEALAGMARKQ